MTPRIETEALQALVENATPGPWAFEAHGDTGDYGVGLCFDPDDLDCAHPLFGEIMGDELAVIEDPAAIEVKGRANAALIAQTPALAAEALESRAVIDHLGDLLAHQMALTDRLTAENAALEAQAITDRKRANATMSDAVMWQFSCADGAHNGQPLLVKVWLQRKEAERSANAALARAAVLETETERWRQVALDGLTRTTGLKADLAAARAEIEHLRSRTEDRIHDC